MVTQPEIPHKTDTKPDSESKYESDTSGSTKAVNSKTKLKDGVYKPDKFSWSGGTGKVNITCDKVTIKTDRHWLRSYSAVPLISM